jgi:hypothetical protein
MLESHLNRPFFILNERMEPQAADPFEYMEWMRKYDTIIAKDWVGRIEISTAFIGVDYDPRPKLFETMVFGDPYQDFKQTHRTYSEAIRFHHDLVGRFERRAVWGFRLQVFWAILGIFALCSITKALL